MDQRLTPTRWHVLFPGYLRRDIAVVVGFDLLFAFILLAIPREQATWIAPVLSALGTFGAIIGIALRGQRWTIGRVDWFTALLGIGCAAMVGGLIVTLGSTLVSSPPIPWPTPTDLMRLVVYPIAFTVIFAMPTRSAPSTARARIVFDGVMVVAAIASISWYLVAGPRTTDPRISVSVILFANLIPLLDVLALSSLLFVAIHLQGPSYRPVVALFSLAILVFALGDGLYGAQLVSGVTKPSPGVIFAWCVAWMIGALGARAWRYAAPEEPRVARNFESARSLPLWSMVLPYGLVVLLGSFAYLVGDTFSLAPPIVGVDVGFGVVLLIVLVRQALVEIEIRRLDQDLLAANRRLAALSNTDPLTDLPNHRALVELIDREIERARRFGRTLGLVFCDLDHFKEVNDTAGHAVGNVVLREFGDLVRRRIRGNDVIGRWGGEEFLVVLPESDLASAGRLAERLRSAVEANQFSGISFQLTCSMGIAVYPHNGPTAAALIDAADRAMYLAKALGRNQIRLATSLDPSEPGSTGGDSEAAE